MRKPVGGKLTPSDELTALGYSPRWETLFEPYAAEGLAPARVIRGDRGSFLVAARGWRRSRQALRPSLEVGRRCGGSARRR